MCIGMEKKHQAKELETLLLLLLLLNFKFVLKYLKDWGPNTNNIDMGIL